MKNPVKPCENFLSKLTFRPFIDITKHTYGYIRNKKIMKDLAFNFTCTLKLCSIIQPNYNFQKVLRLCWPLGKFYFAIKLL